jgi:small-conductance mechanosensitive channel
MLAGPPAWAAAPAAPTPEPALSRAEATSLLAVLNDPAQRAKLIETLRALEKIAPDAPVAPTAAAPAAPAAGAPAAAVPTAGVPAASGATVPVAAKPTIPLAANSILPQIVDQVSTWFQVLVQRVASMGSLINGLPYLLIWARVIMADPTTPRAVLTVSAELIAVLVLAGGAGRMTRLALRPAVTRLAVHAATRTRVRDPNATAADVSEEATDVGDSADDAEADPEPIADDIAPDHDQLPSSDDTPTAPPPPGKIRRLPGRIWQPIRLLPFALLRLLLDLIPVATFAIVGNLVPGIALPVDGSGRLVVLGLVNAAVMFGAISAVTRMLVSPDEPRLRLARLPDPSARYVLRCMQILAGVAVFGQAMDQIGLLWGMDDDMSQALQKLILLVDHVVLVVVVLQSRKAIAARIRPRRGSVGFKADALSAVAGVWHLLAIFLIVGLWLAWAADLRDGYQQVLHVGLGSFAVLVVARLLAAGLLHGVDTLLHGKPELIARYPVIEARLGRYYRVVRLAISLAIGVTALVILLQVWGLDSIAWLTGSAIGQQMIAATLSIGTTIVVALVIWEIANAAIDQHLGRLTRDGSVGKAVRLRTVLPILRTALMVTVLVVAGLTILGQIGVNIAPLLAGAGILGVAIGFGSQKLVQDFITGIFLLLESAMQVGDFVTLAGVSGTVEHLSIRTIRLRAGDGSVHLIPFSSVTTVNNTNRGVGNAAISVMVSAREDTDAVGEVLKQIALEMRDEADFKDKMRSDLQLWGVDKVEGSVVTLVGQIVCSDSGRWGVQREFNRRYKKRFEALGIELPNPTRTVVMRTEPAPTPEPAPVAAVANDDPGPSSASVRESPPPSSLGHTE